MMDARYSGAVRYAIAVLAMFLASVPFAAGTDTPKAELRLKIEVDNDPWAHASFKVVLLNASDQPLMTQLAFGGDTMSFRNLQPAVYRACLYWEPACYYCQSFDVTPSGDAENSGTTWVREATVNPLRYAPKDNLRVSWIRLAVPDNARKEMRRSQEAYLAGDQKLERAHLERALEQWPQYVEAWNNLGNNYKRNGKSQLAVECYQKAVSYDSDFYPAWANLAGAFLVLGKTERALQAGLQALRIRPEAQVANQLVGRCYYYLRDNEKARKYFLKHMAKDPEAADSSQLYLAFIEIRENNYEIARGYIDSFIKLHPHSPRIPWLRRTIKWMLERTLGNRLAVLVP
jgi:tetratricopeptide (TPR) repeat protein